MNVTNCDHKSCKPSFLHKMAVCMGRTSTIVLTMMMFFLFFSTLTSTGWIFPSLLCIVISLHVNHFYPYKSATVKEQSMWNIQHSIKLIPKTNASHLEQAMKMHHDYHLEWVLKQMQTIHNSLWTKGIIKSQRNVVFCREESNGMMIAMRSDVNKKAQKTNILSDVVGTYHHIWTNLAVRQISVKQ